MADEHARDLRLAENERLVRESNWETSVAAADSGATDEEELDLWCACGRSDCTARIAVTLAEYRSAHAHPHRFVVAPGHADDALETVVERRPGYEIVEKRPQFQGADPTSG